MRHRLHNDSHAFVRAIHLRTPGVPIRDVRVGCARVTEPLAWDTPPCRLHIDGDSAELVFQRPDNWARFAFDIVPVQGDASAVAPMGRIEALPQRSPDAVRALLRGKSIAFLGTARSCAQALPASIAKLRELGSLFGAHAIHVYENDSSDDTGALLDHWARDGVLQAIREQGIAAGHAAAHRAPGLWPQPPARPVAGGPGCWRHGVGLCLLGRPGRPGGRALLDRGLSVELPAGRGLGRGVPAELAAVLRPVGPARADDLPGRLCLERPAHTECRAVRRA